MAWLVGIIAVCALGLNARGTLMLLWPFNRRSSPALRATSGQQPSYICDFCGRPSSVVGQMVEGPNQVYICAHCTRFAYGIAESNLENIAWAGFDDTTVRWTGHMHIRCYFHLRRTEDGQWLATASEPAGLQGVGASPQEATRNLQASNLSATAKHFAAGEKIEEYFVNHADKRLRTPAASGGTA